MNTEKAENKELINQVETLVKDIEKTHRYSVSKVYGAWNEVFQKNETPQSCSSCLIRKVKELKEWLQTEILIQEVSTEKEISTSKRKRKGGSNNGSGKGE